MSHYCAVAEARGKMPCGEQCDECRTYEQGDEQMTISETQRAEFEALSRPLIKWLNENCHPHVSVSITPTGAELHEGVFSTGQIMDYVKD